MGVVYEKVLSFKRKYPGTVSWRIKKHSKVVEMFLNPGEEVKYAFAAQKNQGPLQLFDTYVVALTNKRVLMGRKRLLIGSDLITITPDLFNDMQVNIGLIWGKITIDTVKEVVIVSDISKHALPEIETNISEFMMEEKKKYMTENVIKSLKGSTNLTENGYLKYDDVE